MTPFQALLTVTANPAKDLNLDAGTLEAGKFADGVVSDEQALLNVPAIRR